MNTEIQIGIIGGSRRVDNDTFFKTLCFHLVNNLHGKYNLTVYSPKKSQPFKKMVISEYNAKWVSLPMVSNPLIRVVNRIISLKKALKQSDTLLVFGVSNLACLLFLMPFFRKKVILTVDLTLQPGFFDGKIRTSVRKVLYSIAKLFSISIFSDQQVVLPLVPTEKESKHFSFHQTILGKLPPLDSKFVLKITHTHPSSQVEAVLEAFAKFAKYPLVIIANWSQSREGRSIKEKYSKYDHIFLLEGYYFQDKKMLQNLLNQAYVYIHGSTFPINGQLLTQAVTSGIPILAFDEPYNRKMTGEEALYYKNHVQILSHMEEMTQHQADLISHHVSERMAKTSGKALASQYDKMIQKPIEKKHSLISWLSPKPKVA